MLEFSFPDDLIARMDLLTKQEWKVLEKVTMGKTNLQIALELSIEDDTVESHMKHIFEKLGVHSRTQAAVCCIAYYQRTAHLVI